MEIYNIFRINKFFQTDFTIKVNVKKQRRFDRSTVIFKLKSKNFLYALKYTIDYKNANEILTKTRLDPHEAIYLAFLYSCRNF